MSNVATLKDISGLVLFVGLTCGIVGFVHAQASAGGAAGGGALAEPLAQLRQGKRVRVSVLGKLVRGVKVVACRVACQIRWRR